jgi:hypothetical protein
MTLRYVLFHKIILKTLVYYRRVQREYFFLVFPLISKPFSMTIVFSAICAKFLGAIK